MSAGLDGTKPVREGEEVDLDKLRPYLEAHLPEAGDLSNLVIEQFPGGHSNLTYLLKSGDRQWVMRRPPFGSKVKKAHDMGREHRVLDKLAKVRPWAPEPVLFCTDHDVMGADFYLMKRIEGVVLRRTVPKGLTLSEAGARRLCEALIDAFIDLHSIDYEAAGLAELGKPEGYVERQVSGWIRRYVDAKTDDIAEIPTLETWLRERMPESGAATIVHNDFKFDNMLLDPALFDDDGPLEKPLDGVRGILDWEMATLGDPLMDLGTLLCYWVQTDDHPTLQNLAFSPTSMPGMMRRTELCDRYAAATGRDLSSILYYYVFGLYKTAVVCQQIYKRFTLGLTKDPRFGGLIHGVRAMAATAAEAVDRGTV